MSRARAQRALPLRVIQARPRLFVCIAIGILVALIQPQDWRLATRLLIAWNGAVVLYLILGARMMMQADKLSIRRRAQLTDDGKYAFLALSIIAAIASFAAIVLELAGAKDLAGFDKTANIILVGGTIVTSWVFVHLTFTLHYAHEYFADELRTPDPIDVRGGLIFP